VACIAKVQKLSGIVVQHEEVDFHELEEMSQIWKEMCEAGSLRAR
jgi:hypothetical protein